MASTTASIVDNLGHGVRNLGIFRATGRPRSFIGDVSLVVEIPYGSASGTIGTIGAKIAAATRSEDAAAMTATALPAIGTVAITAGTYGVAMAPTSEAIRRPAPELMPGNGVEDLCQEEIEYALAYISAYDASAGIVKTKFSSLSDSCGTSGSPLTPESLIDGHQAVCVRYQQQLEVIAHLSLKQFNQLLKYGLQSASSAWGAPTRSPNFNEAWAAVSAPEVSYRLSWGPIHICVDPKPDALEVSGGDEIGALYVPNMIGLNGLTMERAMAGDFELTPTWAIAYREGIFDAMISASGRDQYKIVDLGSGVKAFLGKSSFVGQNLVQINGVVDVGMHQIGNGCKVISVN